MDGGILIRGIFGLIFAGIMILFSKKLTGFFWAWIPFILKAGTLRDHLGEEKGSKIVLWGGWIILLISIGFILYGIFG